MVEFSSSGLSFEGKADAFQMFQFQTLQRREGSGHQFLVQGLEKSAALETYL